MNKKGISTLKVAATYIGTVVGAGFATGQEILQFFSRFGSLGLAGIFVSALLFIFFGYIIMFIGRGLKAKSHMEIIRYSGGRYIGTIIDVIITFFLFGAFAAMIAGTGALLEQQFNMPGLYGNLIMAALTAATVLTGINGVINSISFVVPFLLAAVIGTSIYSLLTVPPDFSAVITSVEDTGLISNWLLAAILYMSYNTVVAIAVLSPLGVKAQNIKVIRNGALLGGIGLGIGSVMIYLALSGYIQVISHLEVPMIYIAGNISFSVQVIYTIVLIAEIYTTAVGALYGFASRVSEFSKTLFSEKTLIIISTLLALAASQFGFANLVKYLYPIVGYGGLVLLVCLLFVMLKNKNTSVFKRIPKS